VCEKRTTCLTDTEFEVTPGTVTTDRECREIKKCNEISEYEALPPTMISDRICKLNVCQCKHGTGTTGSQCYKHGRSFCSSCDVNFELGERDHRCYHPKERPYHMLGGLLFKGVSRDATDEASPAIKKTIFTMLVRNNEDMIVEKVTILSIKSKLQTDANLRRRFRSLISSSVEVVYEAAGRAPKKIAEKASQNLDQSVEDGSFSEILKQEDAKTFAIVNIETSSDTPSKDTGIEVFGTSPPDGGNNYAPSPSGTGSENTLSPSLSPSAANNDEKQSYSKNEMHKNRTHIDHNPHNYGDNQNNGNNSQMTVFYITITVGMLILLVLCSGFIWVVMKSKNNTQVHSANTRFAVMKHRNNVHTLPASAILTARKPELSIPPPIVCATMWNGNRENFERNIIFKPK
jgi:hypothetical protein